MDSDFIVGIDKSIDAAKGITGKEYPSYLHNTVVTEKLDELAGAIGEGSGGASALSDLTDVDISGSVQGGKVLKFNAVEEKWAPGDDSGNVQSDWNENDPTSGAFILNKPTIPADPGIPTPTASDIDKVVKVESDGQGGARYTLGVGGSAATEIPGTLAAGASTITLQNAAITTDSKIDYYADVFGVHPINAVATNGQIVLTYRPRATAVNIKVVVS